MTSALFTVNGSSAQQPQLAAYGGALAFALVSTTGVNSVAWSVVGASNSASPSFSITPAGTPLGVTASATLPASPGDTLGRGWLVKCVVNGGRDATGQADPALTCTRLVGVASDTGFLPFVLGETTERNATQGWTEDMNARVVSSADVGKVIATVQTVTTTNATPVTVRLAPVSSGKTAYYGARIRGRTSDGSLIARDMTFAYDAQGASVVEPQPSGYSGSDNPWSDSGTRFVSRSVAMGTCVIADQYYDYPAGPAIVLTGKASTTIAWTVKSWKDEF